MRLITLAPELRGSNETIKWLTEEMGLVVSLGHSMSSLDMAEKAFECGASLITHLFNAMLPVNVWKGEGQAVFLDSQYYGQPLLSKFRHFFCKLRLTPP